MSERCVPTGWIVVLALMAIFGIFAELYMIRGRWDKSMQGGALAEERQAALSVATENAKSAKEETQRRRRALTDAQALAKARPPAGSAEAAPEAQAAPDLAVLEAARRDAEEREKESWRDVIEIKKTMGPGPNDVLIMVILLGGMGGFLHMATSLTMYIGNRELYRSWIVYYLLAPFQGAALAVIMYLLVTATVLQLPLGPGAGPVGLNLTGVYGFSALTGLFAKQAIEKLKDVFSMLLTSIVAKDGVVPKS